MNESVREILSLAGSEAGWFHDAAHAFAQFAAKLDEQEKAELDLLAAVYRESAQTVQRTLEKMRENFATEGPSELGSENA